MNYACWSNARWVIPHGHGNERTSAATACSQPIRSTIGPARSSTGSNSTNCSSRLLRLDDLLAAASGPAATVWARGQGAIGDDRDGGTRAHGAGRHGASARRTWRGRHAQDATTQWQPRCAKRAAKLCRAPKRLRRAARGARCCVVPAPSPSAPPWSGRLPTSVRPPWAARREHRRPGRATSPLTRPIPLSPRFRSTPPIPVIPPNRRACTPHRPRRRRTPRLTDRRREHGRHDGNVAAHRHGSPFVTPRGRRHARGRERDRRDRAGPGPGARDAGLTLRGRADATRP